MNQVLHELFEHRAVTSGSGQRHELFPTSITWHKGESLYNWIRSRRPQRTIEIGLAYGVSALFICQALSDNQQGTHIAIDPRERDRWENLGLEQLAEAGLTDLMTFYEAPSHVQLPQLLHEGVQVDFAFVDGNHRFDYVFLDSFYLDRLLSVGGVIAFDDVWLPSVRKVIRFMLTSKGYRVVGFTNRYLHRRVEPAAPWLVWGSSQLLATRFLSRGFALAYRADPLVYLQKEIVAEPPWDFFREF